MMTTAETGGQLCLNEFSTAGHEGKKKRILHSQKLTPEVADKFRRKLKPVGVL